MKGEECHLFFFCVRYQCYLLSPFDVKCSACMAGTSDTLVDKILILYVKSYQNRSIMILYSPSPSRCWQPKLSIQHVNKNAEIDCLIFRNFAFVVIFYTCCDKDIMTQYNNTKNAHYWEVNIQYFGYNRK